MTTEDREQTRSPLADRGRRLADAFSRGMEWLFLDLPYVLFQPGRGLLWHLLGGLGRLLLAVPAGLIRLSWRVVKAFFRWQRPFWVWLARVTGLTALGRVYVQLEKPARIIFWVPVMLTNALLQDIIGALLPVLLVVAVFIYFNKFLIRQADAAPLDGMPGHHPN